MRKELEWNIFDVSYIMWKKLFGYKKKAFTPLKTTKNQRYSLHVTILENLRKINIWECVVGLSATTITVIWRRAIF